MAVNTTTTLISGRGGKIPKRTANETHSAENDGSAGPVEHPHRFPSGRLIGPSRSARRRRPARSASLCRQPDWRSSVNGQRYCSRQPPSRSYTFPNVASSVPYVPVSSTPDRHRTGAFSSSHEGLRSAGVGRSEVGLTTIGVVRGSPQVVSGVVVFIRIGRKTSSVSQRKHGAIERSYAEAIQDGVRVRTYQWKDRRGWTYSHRAETHLPYRDLKCPAIQMTRGTLRLGWRCYVN